MQSATIYRFCVRKRALNSSLLTFFLVASSAWAAGGTPPSSEVGSFFSGPRRLPSKPGAGPPSKRLNRDEEDPEGGRLVFLPPVRVLPPLDTRALIAQDDLITSDNQPARSGNEKILRDGSEQLLRIGTERALALGSTDGRWYSGTAGKVWLARVASLGAVGIRVEFSNLNLPKGSLLAVTADQKIEWVAAKRGSIWSGIVSGDEVQIEYFEPSIRGGEPPLPFQIKRIQHIYRDPLVGSNDSASICGANVACHREWESLSRSVARVSVVKNGSTYVCSGQLVNTLTQDLAPYFLTASHCVGTQEVAASAQFLWHYQNSTCLGADDPRVESSTGSTLLVKSTANTTLLRIDGALPTGLTWAGWSGAKVPEGAPLVAIQHAGGAAKTIAFGQKAAGASCGGGGHDSIRWSDSSAKPGSSGAGVFRVDTGQLVGQLQCGGVASCSSGSASSGMAAYGSFQSAFPELRNLLRRGKDDPLEPNDLCAAARAVSTGTIEGLIVKSADPDWFRMTVPPGRRLVVTTNLENSHGDIDLRLYQNCADKLIAYSSKTDDSESLIFRNTTTEPLVMTWQAFLFSDTYNGYSMSVAID